MNLKDHFINTVATELDHLNGSEFESLCRPLIEIITDREFELKGHNLEMKPVRGSVDLIQDYDCGVIGQCGTDKDYFSGDKALNDIDGSLKNSPNFHTIYLFSNRRATGAELQALNNRVKSKLNGIERLQPAYQYHIYDSQRIANVIYENVYNTAKVTEILSCLPGSYEYYTLLPQTNTLPMQKSGYKQRPEEAEIEKCLMDKDFIQIYGLSGMGKTQIAIAVANNLTEKFDTIIWLDEYALSTGSFGDISIEKMNKSVNLAYLLEHFKVLVIVDNLNHKVDDIMDMFFNYSKKGSKCIVTSLQRNVDKKNAYHLKLLSDEVSKEILNDCKMPPNDDQINLILENVSGFPLLLELSKKSVENEDLTWDEIIEISDMTRINDDEKNEVFAQRIVGHYTDRFNDIFNLLIGIDGTLVSKLFLREEKKLDFNALLSSAIIEDADEYGCRIHSIVLTAIKTVVDSRYSEDYFLRYLNRYLSKHVISRDAGLYTFVGLHKELLLKLLKRPELDDSLRKVIILSYLYPVDTYKDPRPFIELIGGVELDPEGSDIDLRIFIEQLELEFRKYLSETENDEFRRSWIQEKIEILSGLELNSPERKALIYHHIGKWLSDIKRFDESEKYLLKAIEQSPASFNSLLRLARDYNENKMPDKATEKLDAILGYDEISKVPLSIRLAAYELIGSYQYNKLRIRYIDNRHEQFAADIYASISESYTQPYFVIAKLANHLSYNYPEFFSRLCARLPQPLDIENNEKMRKCYGKILSAQYILGQSDGEYREKLFRVSERFLLSVPRNDDYIRKDLIKLYLKANLPQKAKEIARELENNQEKFNLQLLCKVHYANGDYREALECIDSAISKEKQSEKEYCAAFRHDKALCLNALKAPNAVDVMKEAIELQPNNNVKEQWRDELSAW